MDIDPPAALRSRGSKRLLIAGAGGAIVVIVAAAAALVYFGRELRANEPKGGRATAAVPVTVATVLQETVPLRVQAIGNVEAF